MLLLTGYNGADFNPQALIPGAVLVLAGVVLGFWLAFGHWSDRPSVPGVAWLIPAALVWFLLCAGAGAIEDGNTPSPRSPPA